jgi:CheY-like chemotaxis protein
LIATRGLRADHSDFALEVVLRRFHTGAGELICAVMRMAEPERKPGGGNDAVEPEPIPDVIAGFEGPSKKILIVDDKRDRRVQIDRVLRPLGFQLIHAENGHQAVARAEQDAPDLILMDLVMPVMDGLEATRAIRRTGKTSLPIIAVSSPAFEGLRDKAGAAGCDGVLTKPISRRKLLALMGRHLSLTWIHLGAPSEQS